VLGEERNFLRGEREVGDCDDTRGYRHSSVWASEVGDSLEKDWSSKALRLHGKGQDGF